MPTKFRLFISIFVIIALNSCKGTSDEIFLLPSGFYDNCISVFIKKNVTKLNNQKVESDGETEICNNTTLELFDNEQRIAERVYLFNNNYQQRNVLSDATTLWYNNTSTIRHDDVTYISYVTSVGNVVIREYEHKSKTFSEEQIIWTFDIGDDHSAPVIEINEDNKIVLLFSFHSSPLFSAISINELDISDFNVNEIDSGYITYPNLFKLDNNTLIAFFRKGFPGNNSKGEYHKMLSNDGGATWEDSEAVITFENDYIIYAFPKVINKNIYIAFSSLDRQTGILSDMYYTYSLDNSHSWLANDGFEPYITSISAIKLLSKDNIRIHSISGFQNDILISYSSFAREYSCCNNTNELSVYSINEDNSIVIGNGLINYYSDGIIFDDLMPNLAFYISRIEESPDKRNIVGGLLSLEPLRFDKIGEVKIDKKISRLTQLKGNYPGKLHWLEVDDYISYQNFITSLSFPVNL